MSREETFRQTLNMQNFNVNDSSTVNLSVTRRETEDTNEGVGCCGGLVIFFSVILCIFTFPFSLCLILKVVNEYERVVIMRLGRVSGGARGPGLFSRIPCVDSLTVCDLRTVTFDVPYQEILTKDSVTISVDAVVYYRVFDPVVAVIKVESYDQATKLLAQTTLRNTLGTKSLAEILGEREHIADVMQDILDKATHPWGISVERVEIKDCRLPATMQRSMAAEAEASREARAKVIAAEGEKNAARSLKEASDIINESPFALQLRYLQTLTTIASENNSTVVFPLPIEILKHFSK